MTAVRVPWSSASFLVYLGGLTILGSILSFLATQSIQYGATAFVLWALLVFSALAVLALLAKRSGHFVTAGLLAVSGVWAFVVLLGAILDWFGRVTHFEEPGFSGFHVSLLFLELALVVASAVALRLFRFPLLAFFVAAGSWYFVTDFLSGGGDWSAILTIAIGLILLVAAIVVDEGPSKPFAFWLHVVSGLTIGGGLLWFFHDSNLDWIVIAVVGLAYIWLGDRLSRSSWVVLGAWGMLQTTSYFADKWSEIGGGYFFPFVYLFPGYEGFGDRYAERHAHPWAGPFAFAVVGVVFTGIALWLARRRRAEIPSAELI